MCHPQDTVISKTCLNPKEFTRIIFTSDLKRFQMDKFDDDDFVSLFKRCAYNVVISTGCKVALNINDRWDIGVAKNDYNNDFQQASFVNSILTSENGKHIDYITEQICPKLAEHIKKKSKAAAAAENLKPMQVENHLFICVNYLIEYLEFESQAKQNKLATEGITKLDYDNHDGTKSSQYCTLIVTEEDSAKALAVAALGVIGRDRYDEHSEKGPNPHVIMKFKKNNRVWKVQCLLEDDSYVLICGIENKEWPPSIMKIQEHTNNNGTLKVDEMADKIIHRIRTTQHQL
ncbi:unnamed protein product [Rotaria sp. Silwood1]|nr:unnamed protein product [Rotaria sp. Silwood1]